MKLTQIEIHRLRNIQHAALQFSPTCNLIFGPNGSGKSALLEAIHLLGRGKSFRTHQLKQVIQYGENETIIVAHFTQDDEAMAWRAGMRVTSQEVNFHLGTDHHAKRSDLARVLPMQWIDPCSYLLITGSPQYRREFVDWGVFNEYPDFLASWRRYRLALLQRNQLLKTRTTASLESWDQQVILYGTQIAEYRERYLQQLLPIFLTLAEKLLPLPDLTLHYLAGWPRDKTLSQSLHDDLAKDLRHGFTHNGPHRGDFVLYAAGRPVNEFISRGQLKLLVLALKLAQVALSSPRSKPCVLIDDIGAELDPRHLQLLLDVLSLSAVQIFVTATQFNPMFAESHFAHRSMFHVEHGKIAPIEVSRETSSE